MASEVEIRPACEADLPSLHNAINSVCCEKWFLGSVEELTLEQCCSFWESLIKHGWPQVVAVDKNRVVGWCNIVPDTKKGFTHVGRLGMGVIRGCRRKGIGRRLIDACLSLAGDSGLEKVELGVYADNDVAICLYKSCGFMSEGVKKRARKLEGRYQDVRLMALSLEKQ